MEQSPALKQVAQASSEQLVVWAQAQKKRLMDACVAAGHDPATLRCATLQGSPFGNWKAKGFVLEGDKPVASFWLSFRRLHKRSKITVPRFNIETSPEVEKALAPKAEGT